MVRQAKEKISVSASARKMLDVNHRTKAGPGPTGYRMANSRYGTYFDKTIACTAVNDGCLASATVATMRTK